MTVTLRSAAVAKLSPLTGNQFRFTLSAKTFSNYNGVLAVLCVALATPIFGIHLGHIASADTILFFIVRSVRVSVEKIFESSFTNCGSGPWLPDYHRPRPHALTMHTSQVSVCD